MAEENRYIHGTAKQEQGRLKLLNSITNGSFINFLGESLENIDGRKIADFGCGTGDLMSDIAGRYKGAQITGVEISKAQYDEAVAKMGGNPNLTLINSDVLSSGLEDESFDLCYCRYLLEHIPDPVAVAKEMFRVVKQGGLIKAQENDLAVVFYHPEVDGLEAVCREFCALQMELGGDPFIGRKLFDIFKRAGAVDITLTYEPEIYTEDDPERYRAWMTNALNIYQGAKERMVKRGNIDEASIDRVLDILSERIARPEGVSLFHWNRVSARKG
ncbi:MAG: methyltransferase domain-containing protein [Deltaproteobacteria bacterium]|uniref:Methyltransferase domain-containing protein n=1 Tax=Candidatus Zymogenus saltonus TaxID=2844893 RepID=A0A9D8KDI0_9DELT|nr:methyltransferase domain-containing protein [Candidatus Zymogenus saltonus]